MPLKKRTTPHEQVSFGVGGCGLDAVDEAIVSGDGYFERPSIGTLRRREGLPNLLEPDELFQLAGSQSHVWAQIEAVHHDPSSGLIGDNDQIRIHSPDVLDMGLLVSWLRVAALPLVSREGSFKAVMEGFGWLF